MNLNDLVRSALTGNDIEVFEKMLMLRKECRERGIHTDEVTRIVRLVLNEDSKPAAMPEPEAPQPVAPEPPKAVQDKRTESELSRHHGQGYEPKTTRKDSDSMILRMADEKKGR